MKIGYVVYITNPQKIDTWNDGFKRAMDLLGAALINVAKQNTFEDLNRFDVLIYKTNWHWLVDQFYVRYKKHLTSKSIIMISGSLPPRDLTDYDLLLYETPWYYETFIKDKAHSPALHAFGINTEIMKNIDLPADYDWISAGRFNREKKGFDEICRRFSTKGIIVGERQEPDYFEQISNYKHVHTQDYVAHQLLCELYNRSLKAICNTTVQGGGERFVLESMSCGLEIINLNNNPKIQSLIDFGLIDHNYYHDQIVKSLSLL